MIKKETIRAVRTRIFIYASLLVTSVGTNRHVWHKYIVEFLLSQLKELYMHQQYKMLVCSQAVLYYISLF
jgi:hypothetical protein